MRGPAIYFLLAGLLVATVLVAAGIGPYRIAPDDVTAAILRYLFGATGAGPNR